jgi:dipeptidyl aminopeptidase/acylaminoacyl peptidase
MKFALLLIRRFAVVLFVVDRVTQGTAAAELVTPPALTAEDVFEIEFATDPHISPDGQLIVYVRNSFDALTDRQYSTLWSVRADGSDHRPLTSGSRHDGSPRWSPDGSKLLYVSKGDESEEVDSGAEIFCRWMDSGQTAQLTRLPKSPSGLTWSRDGKQIAFTMQVPFDRPKLANLASKPEKAKWAKPPILIERVKYRFDGKGYLEDAYQHVFVVSADGGTPRQISRGNFDFAGPLSWTADNASIVCASNMVPNWELEPRRSELFAIDVKTSELTALTDSGDPDHAPTASPDGKKIAWLSFIDRKIGSQLDRLHVMNSDGSDKRVVPLKLDRSLQSPVWNSTSDGVFVQYDDQGHTKLARVTLTGELTEIATDVGGTTIGRPYQSGSFSASNSGVIVFTATDPLRPADVAIVESGKPSRTLTSLNADLFEQRSLGAVEEFWFESSHDQQKIQAWLVTPPGYKPGKDAPKLPLILEIHGGPFANYGSRFAAEMQLYAAAGYAVLYVNPRGSTGYGQKFVEEIHHAYPGHDYDDLMSGVDEIVKRGVADPNNLFVTGGSGGGILTAWVVGKTGRFKAAVSAKPVINWYSFALTTDVYPYFWQYWFSDYPWNVPNEYLARSPISLVGNVTTPTMLLTGENDHRTPISESEQFYQALKLRGVDSAMVRIPDASHGIVARPSNLGNKVAYVLGWFERYRK